jgi:hypothetical protein
MPGILKETPGKSKGRLAFSLKKSGLPVDETTREAEFRVRGLARLWRNPSIIP